MRLLLALASLVALPCLAHAQDVLSIDGVRTDPPTLITLGVQVLVSGDADFDATIEVRYRPMGETAWHDGPPLYRVHPETSDMAVPEQLAGSIFDLAPATTYEIELHAVDPDGLDETRMVTATTRAVPADPTTPREVSVSSASELSSALGDAAAGDVITLAAGEYHGNFATSASGTEAQPIVIRGADRDGVILDGDGCTGCNVLEVYGSYVHVESLTIENASRALRFQGSGAVGNVVRRVHVRDVTLGIGSRDGQEGFYVCDNELEGRLSWPAVYRDDGGAHANDDGIRIEGTGHVVCHNRIVGFGDAIKIETDGARAIDFYGNEILSAYDNGVELDAMTGNGRAFRNRFTNTYATLSVQPIYGGPVYLVRNVVVNVADEQIKWHGIGSGEGPSGVLVYHNTFVSPDHAIQTATSATSHWFVLRNNLFVGSADDGTVIQWDAPIDHGDLDYDGFAPDGRMFFRGGAFDDFAAMQADGTYEPNGVLLTAPIFASGLEPPDSYTTRLDPADATLAPGSNAIDRGTTLVGIDDDFTGTAPDLGALERGCPVPMYGVRPAGVDESTASYRCDTGPTPGTDGGVPGPDGGSTGSDGGRAGTDSGPLAGTAGTDDEGCGCRVSAGRAPRVPLALAALSALLFAARRRK